MLRVSQLSRMKVYRPKRKAEGDPTKMDESKLAYVGKIHLTVFDPKGRHVVGFLVKKPDVASMVKVPDAFLAFDSFDVCDFGLVSTRDKESWDDAARDRLGLDWDHCLIWTGMDAKTTDGKDLGWVDDVEFSPKSGKAKTFFIGDGGLSKQLVGTVEIPADMLRGYKDGFILFAPEAAHAELDGGFAAKAGEGYARAKYEGAKAGKKFAASAGTAIDKGAFGLGKLIGKAQKAIEGAQAEDEAKEAKRLQPEPVEVESQVLDASDEVAGALNGEVSEDAAPEPTVFVPVSELEDAAADEEHAEDAGEPAADEGPAKAEAASGQKAASKKKATSKKKASGKGGKSKSGGDAMAKAFGKQLGSARGMFGSFVEEYKKASK